MKVCSIFSQVLKLFSRGEFEKAVKEHKAERHARGCTSWGQFMAMLFCQLGRAHSLREICGGLACCEGQLKHLGVPVAPKKSTISRCPTRAAYHSGVPQLTVGSSNSCSMTRSSTSAPSSSSSLTVSMWP